MEVFRLIIEIVLLITTILSTIIAVRSTKRNKLIEEPSIYKCSSNSAGVQFIINDYSSANNLNIKKIIVHDNGNKRILEDWEFSTKMKTNSKPPKLLLNINNLNGLLSYMLEIHHNYGILKTEYKGFIELVTGYKPKLS